MHKPLASQISDGHRELVMSAVSSQESSPANARTILVTGAAGYLGGVLRAGLRKQYWLRLTDRAPLPTPLVGSEEFFLAELSDLDALSSIMSGVDGVVHLGGNLKDGPWDAIFPDNIVGTYNVFECARRCQVKRMIFASSHHVVGFYRRGRKVGVEDPVRPDSFYGVSKVFGEALGRLYADKHGLSVICQRIGVARARPPHRRSLSNWISEHDYIELTRCCIEARDVHYLIVFGASGSKESFYDNAPAKVIGFTPRDNTDSYREDLSSLAPDPEGPIEELFQGGAFCAVSFNGDPVAID
jgi:uronate dehydrogenase